MLLPPLACSAVETPSGMNTDARIHRVGAHDVIAVVDQSTAASIHVVSNRIHNTVDLRVDDPHVASEGEHDVDDDVLDGFRATTSAERLKAPLH